MKYSDLTGRYTIILIRGNQYIVICYDYETNRIYAISTKTRNAVEIRDTKMSMLNTLTTSGHQPYLHIFDNEESSSIKKVC